MYQTYTRAQLRAQLQLRWEESPFWTTADANLALNHALRVWNLLTSYWRARVVVTTTPNDPLVPIPGTLAQQTALTWQGRTMTGVSVAELLLLEPNTWQARTTDGGRVPARPLFWAPVGLNLVQLYPASAVAGSVEVDGVRRTPVLAADGDFVDIGPEELSTLLGYALHAAAFKGGAALLERTKAYLGAFIEAAATRNQALKRTRWYAHFHEHGYHWETLPPATQPGAPDSAQAGVPAS